MFVLFPYTLYAVYIERMPYAYDTVIIQTVYMALKSSSYRIYLIGRTFIKIECIRWKIEYERSLFVVWRESDLTY